MASKYYEFAKLALLVGQVSGGGLSLGAGSKYSILAKVGLYAELSEYSEQLLRSLIDQSEGDELIIHDLSKLDHVSDVSLLSFQFLATVPMLDDDRNVLGGLIVIDDKPNSLNSDQLDGLRNLANMASKLLKSKEEKTKVEAALAVNNPFYLAFNSAGEIVSFSDAAKKVFNEKLERNQHLEDLLDLPKNFFLEDSVVAPTKPFSLNSLDSKMKFTCVKMQAFKVTYLAFTPVVNARYPLVNYSLSIPEISGLNHLPEYIFLRETTELSIQDYDKITDRLSRKNKELLEKNEDIRRSEESYKRLFDSNMAGVFTAKFSGEYLRVNKSCLEIYGWESLEDAKKHKFSDFFLRYTIPR